MVAFQKMNILGELCRILLILGLVFSFTFIYLSNEYSKCSYSDFFSTSSQTSFIEKIESTSSSRTNLSHLVFGLVGSEKAWHHRKAYIESWWQPNGTRGVLFLDQAPTQKLLPWSPNSPPYKISENLTVLLNKTEYTAQRIIHGIMETFKEVDHQGEHFRWLVMGDDDSLFFLENMVDVLAKYDHTKYYYIGGHSEFILSNFWYSFDQGFGGAGLIFSYPLAKALADDMENCLKRYTHLDAADQTTQACAADLGVSLTPLKGIHQIDIRDDLSGFLSAHPNFPLMSLHHFDAISPIYPSKNRIESTRHLMAAAEVDQSRMLQQTICYHRASNWSLSISWGYSAQIYENIMPRSYLQKPIETFHTWKKSPRPPHYMFNTRPLSKDPCEAPHVFFYESMNTPTKNNEVLTIFSRNKPRGLKACSKGGNHSADSISRIRVFSPSVKRVEIDRSECCDVVGVEGDKADIKFRDCKKGEIIA